MNNIITSDVSDVVLDPKSLIDNSDELLLKQKSKMLEAIKDLDELLENQSLMKETVSINSETKPKKIGYTLQLMSKQTKAKFNMYCNVNDIQFEPADNDYLKINIGASSEVKLMKLITFFIRQKELQQDINKSRKVSAFTATPRRKKRKKKRNDVYIIGLYGLHGTEQKTKLNLINSDTGQYRITNMHFGVQNNQPFCMISCTRN